MMTLIPNVMMIIIVYFAKRKAQHWHPFYATQSCHYSSVSVQNAAPVIVAMCSLLFATQLTLHSSLIAMQYYTTLQQVVGIASLYYVMINDKILYTQTSSKAIRTDCVIACLPVMQAKLQLHTMKLGCVSNCSYYIVYKMLHLPFLPLFSLPAKTN